MHFENLDKSIEVEEENNEELSGSEGKNENIPSYE